MPDKIKALNFLAGKQGLPDKFAGKNQADFGLMTLINETILSTLLQYSILYSTFDFRITCQAGNDQDRKGFCAVYSTLVRLTISDTISYTDAMTEEVEKKCMGVCKKVNKGNSHKEAREGLCKWQKFILHNPPGQM